jgi:hypothetical protein
MSDWIADLCTVAIGDDSAKAEGSLDVAGRLSAIATQNVRVDQGGQLPMKPLVVMIFCQWCHS